MTANPRLPRKLAWAGFFCFVLAVIYLGRIPLLQTAGRLLNDSDPLGPTDFALVLGGGNETRPFVAASLYHCGLVDQILLTTVKTSAAVREGIVPISHEVSRRVLVLRKVPEDKIVLLPRECASTYDEALSIKQLLDSHPTKTVAVVTTDYHTRRAKWAFRRVLGPQAAQVRFVAAPANGFSASDWWQTEAGFLSYLDELGKLAFYVVYYNPLWLGAIFICTGGGYCLYRLYRARSVTKDIGNQSGGASPAPAPTSIAES